MNLKLWQKILIPILLLISIIFILIIFLFQRSLKQEFIQEEFLATYETVVKHSNIYLDEKVLRDPETVLSKEILKNFARDVNDTSVTILKIWGVDYSVVYSGLDSIVGFRDSSNPYIRRSLEAKEAFFVVSSDVDPTYFPDERGEFISIYIPISFAGEIIGVVEIHKAYEAFLGPINDNIHNSTLILLVSLIIITIFIFVIIYFLILKPLQVIKISAQNIGIGKLDHKVTFYSHDEIGELAKSFDKMRQTLKEREDDLTQSNLNLEKSSLELKEKVVDLENTKKAVVNLLEDVEEEKKGVEGEVLERTAELSIEKARLVASINSIPFGFIVADVNNQILLRNKVFTEMFNLDNSKDFSIDDIANIIGKDFSLKSEVEWCIRGGGVCEIKEIVFGGKVLRGIVAPVGGGNNNLAAGYILLLEDITEAKALERSRDEFFSIASHELRTPLTAIRGNSQMLQDSYKDKMVDKDMSDMINDIHESSLRLIDIVNDFLEVSRLEQGRIVIKKEKIDLAQTIEKVIKDMDGIISEKGIPIFYSSSSAKLPLVYSDKARIEQILFNLLGNALKFTQKGSVTIETEFVDGFIKVSVIDTGIGISEINQSLLFRKFQQAGEQVLARDVTKGTGLGLYICRLLAGKLGITIGLVKSVVGEGSVFAFTVPIDVIK